MSTISDKGQDLRRRAEEKALSLEALNPKALDVEETRRLLHELRVHQIELEMQNEELRRPSRNWKPPGRVTWTSTILRRLIGEDIDLVWQPGHGL